MKLKGLVGLAVWLIGIVVTGVLAFVAKDTTPLAGGMLAGMSVFLIFGMVIERKYGHIPVSSILPKSVVLKLGLWPIAILVLWAVFLMYLLPSAPFLLGFLETGITVAIYMFAMLAVVVKNLVNGDYD